MAAADQAGGGASAERVRIDERIAAAATARKAFEVRAAAGWSSGGGCCPNG